MRRPPYVRSAVGPPISWTVVVAGVVMPLLVPSRGTVYTRLRGPEILRVDAEVGSSPGACGRRGGGGFGVRRDPAGPAAEPGGGPAGLARRGPGRAAGGAHRHPRALLGRRSAHGAARPAGPAAHHRSTALPRRPTLPLAGV